VEQEQFEPMTAIHFDTALDDEKRRQDLYDGALYVYSPTQATREFASFARGMIAEAFGDDDPQTVQDRMAVEDYAEVLTTLKPNFIHHPESKRYVQRILSDLGCDEELVHFDVPRLRSSTSGGYLTTGIAYAWHPHRDTWYSAPKTQINIWLPVFDLDSENTVAFHPPYFRREVPNDSKGYNYYEWNTKYRAAAAEQVSSETRPLPRPTEEVELDSKIEFVVPVGGMVLFSAAHLHSSVPNTSGKTRFSIDFRIVHTGDIRAGKGAPTQDVHCTGSNIRDFMRAKDLAPVSQDIVELFRDGTEDSGDLTYERA
jgi:hypothetical protein